MPESNDTITLHISLIQENGRVVDVQVPGNCSVGELKRAIETTCVIEADSQLLIYLGRVLHDNNKSIQDYHIVNGATIQLNVVKVQRDDKDPSFSYEVERKLLERRLQHVRDNYATEYFGWQTFLSLQGARLPEGNDRLQYPSGTSLEFIRQGLLTYNTYISALDLPASCTPAYAPTQLPYTKGPNRTRRFYVGQWIDALDTVNKWLEATVMAVRDDYLFVHYNGWDVRWDEWLHANSRRVAPFRTRTRYLSLRSTLTPDVITWSHNAPLTGSEDASTLLYRIQEANSSVWKAVNAVQRQEGESEEAWKARRSGAMRQLAPLMDRVGRLTADASAMLRCEAMGGEIETMPPENERPEEAQPALPPLPQRQGEGLDPRFGMDSSVNGSMSENESILPIRASGSIREIMIPLNDDGPLPQNTQIQSFLQLLRRLVDNPGQQPGEMEAPERVQMPAEEMRPPRSQVLSNSVGPAAVVGKPSLINRLQDIGVLDRDSSLNVDRSHAHELD